MIANPGSRDCCRTPRARTFVVVRVDVKNRHGQKLFPAVPQFYARPLIHIEETQGLRIDYLNGIVRLVQQRPEQRQFVEHPLPLPRRLQQLFVGRAQRLLRPHPFRDVVRDPSHNRRCHSLGSQRVVILPDPLLSRSRHHRHQTARLPVRSISRR